MPPLITCLVVKVMGSSNNQGHWDLRELAADHLANICNTYAHSYTSLAPRVTRTLMRALTDPDKDLTTQYGALVALSKLGVEVMHSLLVPYLLEYYRRLEKFRTDLESKQLDSGHHMDIDDQDKVQDSTTGVNSIALTKCFTALRVKKMREAQRIF
jgi:transcription initiation factor TFIID subunit 6